MGKQVGPTPITAKLKRTTKGGIVQPQLKTLQSPAQKALVGKQHNLPQHLKDKIEAAPESPAKQRGRKRLQRTDSLSVKPERRGSGDRARARSRARGRTNITQTKQPGSKDPNFGVSPSSRMPVSQPVPELLKGPSKPRKKTKTVSAIKPKGKTASTAPKASTEIKPKVKTTKKAETSIKADKLRAKGEKALAEGKTGKAQRLKKRYARKTKRDENKAARQEKRAYKKGLRKTKRSLIKQEIAKLRDTKKEIRSYTDY